MKIFNYKNCTAVFSDKSDGDLNFYTYSEEQLEAIRKQLSKSLNHDIKFPVYVDQVHKADVVQVSKNEPFPTSDTKADAIITDLPETPIGVFTADCCPVLIAGPDVVSATHAGWKSTLQCICQNTVLKYNELYNIKPTELTAWIGPCIGECCFELGDEVYDMFVSKNPKWSQFFVRFDKWHLNLRALNRFQLEEAGIPSNQIIDYNHCTLCQADKYFSYRREHQKNGSMFSFIYRS